MKLTENQERVLEIFKENFADGGFAEEVVEKVEGATIASVRATLSSLATKGALNKTKDVYEGKEKTRYTLTETAE